MSLLHSPRIVTDGLVLCLDAANKKSYPGSGTTWFDLSGRNNNGTVSAGQPYFLNNIANGVIDFRQGADSRPLTISKTDLSTGASIPHSLEIWVNFDVLNTSNRWWLAVLGQNGPGALHWISRGDDLSIGNFGVWNGGCQQFPSLVINKWLNLVSTFDGSNLIVYVNKIATSPCSATNFNFSETQLRVGQDFLGEVPFDGKISIIKLYNRGLSASEVNRNFDAVSGRFGL